MFSVIYRYVIQYKKNVNYFYLSFKFYFAFFMIFFSFFWFLKFIALKYFPLYRILCLISATLSCFLFLSLEIFLFCFGFFLYLILTLKLTILVIYRACGSVRVLCLCAFFLCIISTRSLFLSFSISLFLLVYLFFLSCCSACLSTVLHLAYLSLIIVRLYDLKLRLQKKKHIVDYICIYSSHSWC